MKLELLRYIWWQKQGLDGTLRNASAADVLHATGWARSVGGVGPYLTLFARNGMSRSLVDAALADREIHELPAARNCTYVVPKADFGLALRVGQEFEGSDMKAALKLGVTVAEIDKLCTGVLKALKSGPMDPTAIREATGKLSRSLGEEGKKKGVSTTLPLALSRLQALGEIRRIPIDGRLDQQRYRYDLWSPSPITSRYPEYTDAYRELATRFFTWVGPATFNEFKWYSGLGVRQVQAILGTLPIVPISPQNDRYVFKSECDTLSKVKCPTRPQYALLSSLDSLFAARRDIVSFIDDNDRAVPVLNDKKSDTLGRLSDLPSHGIFDRGRLIGLWEYDVDRETIVSKLFVKKDKQLLQAIDETQEFVRSQLGDARSFSLDSPKSREARIRHLESL